MAGQITQPQSGSTTPAALNTPLLMGATVTNHGIYVLRVSLANLAAAETVNFTVTDGTGIIWQLGTFTGVQTPAGTRLGPIDIYDVEAAVSLKVEQTAGTLRAFPWKLVRIHDDTVTG